MNRKIAVSAAGGIIVGALITGGIAASVAGTSRTVPRDVTVTKTVYVPEPVTKIVYVPKVKVVPKIVVKTVPPPPPPPGATLLDYTGTGTAATPDFTSGSGDYTVSWVFSGNNTQGGTGGDNFIVNENNQNSFAGSGDLPNVIQTSGSGSTMITGDSGTHSFDVQSDQGDTFTIKVVANP